MSEKTKVKVCNLKCEYRKNPVGIDVLQPGLSWQLKGKSRNIKQTAYQIQVSEADAFNSYYWDSGKIESDKSVQIKYKGPALKSRKRYYYRIRIWDQNQNRSEWSSINYWEMGILDQEEWQADWITSPEESSQEKNSPYLRKEFNLEDEIKSARVYVTALGLYELELNGEKVGEDCFTPGWTSYNKRLQYQTYEIEDLLQPGKNVVGAMLGNGWYRGELAWEDQKNIYGDKRALLCQLHIKYKNGEEKVVCSDNSWKASTGPILMSEIYHGEIYDARLEEEGWSLPDFDDSTWESVKTINQNKEILVAQENEPVRKIETIKPVELITTPAGETVIDMGQNLVGRVRFAVEGKAGDKVILKHAEVLDKEGNFYTDNLRKARQTVEYTLKGEGKEIYEPYFTFQGFRYVKVEEYPGEITLDNFKGIVLHSDMERTGNFSCSNDLVNQLQHNIIWGQKGNFLDVPTDCPQRDERLGWTGDAQVFINTAAFNMNVALFFRKWLRDLKADQLENGGVPAVIPDVLEDKVASSSAWGDAAVICPWTLYKYYGDKKILQEQYESMKAWVEYIRNQGKDEYLWNTGHHFGDWLALDSEEGSYTGRTDKDYIATAFFAYSTSLLKKTAVILNKKEDAEKYRKLQQNIVSAFRREFVTPNGRIAVPTQTAQILALKFDLVKKEHRSRIIEKLVDLIEENDVHLDTGFVGTPYLCQVLSKNGYHRLAQQLIEKTDYPSWLYQVTKGATTIWEHWDGIKEDGSFWSDDMNSFNHYAYGSIGDWLYRIVGGINPDIENPGFKKINIKPHPGSLNKGFNYAEVSHQSMYGNISCKWKKVKENNAIQIKVEIPENTSATVILPGARQETLTEADQVISEDIPGINKLKEKENRIEMKLGSGCYNFNYKVN
ncbi:MAG: family 78 glycoside hydrolase catalytic domain [Halanaerobiales bacterium]